jgi:hypothetical protein
MFPLTLVLGIYSESIHISTVSSDPFKCFLSKNVCIMDGQSFSNNQGQSSKLVDTYCHKLIKLSDDYTPAASM